MTRRAARAFACLAIVAATAATPAPAGEKDGDDQRPRVTLTNPLAVVPGSTVLLTVRGLRLSEAGEVRFADAPPGLKAVVKAKGKAELPQGVEAAEAGDTRVEVELAVPAATAPGTLSFVVVTPAGQTPAHGLVVADAGSLVQEKEPNDGFRGAQELAVSRVVQGVIQSADDVDVFRFEGKAGRDYVAEVTAARRGSALDSLLTLYDASGHPIASDDDADEPAGTAGEGSARARAGAGQDLEPRADANADPAAAVAGARARLDSVLRFRCPSDGAYYLAVSDAGARGGPTHPYLLSLKAAG